MSDLQRLAFDTVEYRRRVNRVQEILAEQDYPVAAVAS